MQYVLLFFIALLPGMLHAQATVTSIVTTLTGVVNSFIRAGLAIALLVFVWGLAKTMIAMNSGGSILDADGKKSSGTGKAITEGKNRMIWGVVGLFVLVSVWGLVALLAQILGVPINTSTAATPIFQYGNI